MPTVSVIVVNWNGRELLRDCLESLARQDFDDFELILVDNGSEDGSLKFVASVLDQFKVKTIIENGINKGFAEANNIGIVFSSGKYIALLNNDAVADPFWLRQLVECAEFYPQVGMFASKIIRPDGRLDSSGCTIYPDGIGVCRGRGKDHRTFDREHTVAFPSGCAALYRRDMLDQIGLFDERFFAYCEDTDLGLRAQRAGWTCLYVPSAVVTHRYSQTLGAYSLKKLFLVERNRIWVILKNFTFEQIFWSFPYTIIRYFKMLRKGLAWSE